jgi:hypothetical protein
MEQMMTKRIVRALLDEKKSYVMIKMVGGAEIRTEVGRFVRSYCMGSGDGMTLHWEFNKEGKVTTVDDEMWGSVGGQELVQFEEVR